MLVKKVMVTQWLTKKDLSPKGGWLGRRREIGLGGKDIGTEKYAVVVMTRQAGGRYQLFLLQLSIWGKK